MASIRRLPSGSYQVQIRRAGMPAVTPSFSRKRDVEAFARTVEVDSELARKLGRSAGSIPTFRALCDIYMEQYQGREQGTPGMLNWWCGQFGDRPVTAIDEYMVDEGLIEHSKRKGRGGRPLTGSTINRYKSKLSAVFICFIRHPDFKRLGFTNPVCARNRCRGSGRTRPKTGSSARQNKKPCRPHAGIRTGIGVTCWY